MQTFQPPAQTCFIGSANPHHAVYAVEEVRRLWPDLTAKELEENEIVLLTTSTSLESALTLVKQKEPMFLRHLQPVEQVGPLTRNQSDFETFAAIAQQETRFSPGEKVAIQVRRTPGITYDYTAFGVKEKLDPLLVELFGVEPVVRDANWVISLYLSEDQFYWGVSHPQDNLSDWSGGMIRFRQELGQISRAKFKLLEAETRFRLDFGQFHNAIDLGAAPGGWTSLLLERGLQVTAIDPATLHPSLLSHPQLRYLARSVNHVNLPDQSFDLLVCDMNGSPQQMAHLVERFWPTLKVGAKGIVTVKLLHKKPFQTVKEVLAIWGKTIRLIAAKQLYHNRDEVTLYVQKKD